MQLPLPTWEAAAAFSAPLLTMLRTATLFGSRTAGVAVQARRFATKMSQSVKGGSLSSAKVLTSVIKGVIEAARLAGTQPGSEGTAPLAPPPAYIITLINHSTVLGLPHTSCCAVTVYSDLACPWWVQQRRPERLLQRSIRRPMSAPAARPLQSCCMLAHL